MSVKEVMDSWTLQTGFPVVTVKRNYQEGTALITQVRGGTAGPLQTGFPVLTVKRNYQEGTAIITQVRGEQLSSPR